MHDAQPKSPCEPSTCTNCQSIGWYAEGVGRAVEVEGVIVVVKYLGRKGRRARIIIEAPSGAVFQDIVQAD